MRRNTKGETENNKKKGEDDKHTVMNMHAKMRSANKQANNNTKKKTHNSTHDRNNQTITESGA